jgi:hypothetical protein
VLLSGCASAYFQPSRGDAPEVRHELASWPYREYWTGFVFNGNKIGFSRLQIVRVGEDRYEVRSQASFLLRFLGITKRLQLQTTDEVDSRLRLLRFDHDYLLDDSRLAILGEARNGELITTVNDGRQTTQETHRLDGPIHPASALVLYPLLQGLKVGARYTYPVYDGQTRNLAVAEQTVEAWEESTLFEEPAFRVITRLHGLETKSWLNERGLPVLELGLNGVLISALEDETKAKQYLLQASLNKQETVLDFSRVALDRELPQPGEIRSLEIAFSELPEGFTVPDGPAQSCRPVGAETVCIIRRAGHPAEPSSQPPLSRYLRPTQPVPVGHARIQSLARDIGQAAGSDRERVERILDWIRRHVRRSPVDVFSALDVLEAGEAECQGHAYLYAALARAMGIPTRVANGLVYSQDLRGLVYHSWAESLVDGSWLAVDPTFAQIPADATHIKLLEGELPSELTGLVELVGKVRARVLTVQTD